MATVSIIDKLPKITFDTTLADLYAVDAKDGHRPKIALLPWGWLTTFSFGAEYPRAVKLVMQDFFVDLPEPFQLPPHLSKLMKVGMFNLIIQRDTFAAGNIETIFITFDDDQSSPPQSKIEVEKTISTVHPSQRMRPLYISRPHDLQALVKEQGIDLLAPKMFLDDLYNHKLTCDVNTLYYINSKPAIVTSGLPTPRSTIVQLGPEGFDPRKCCSYCAADPEGTQIPNECVGPRRTWINRNIARASAKIRARELPFVLKLPMSGAGKGTFVVTSEEERTELIEKLEKNILIKMLSWLIPANAHLNPASLVLMDYISELVGNWGITFFVTQTGKSIFLGASEQRLKAKVRWKGSTIDYLAQERLQERFTPIMNQIGDWLHSYGYYGPIGADVLESPSGRNGETATDLYVVDLNVRTSGSLNIVLMGEFFSKQRGFHLATSFFLESEHNRDFMMSKFSKEFEEGRIVITAWYENAEIGAGAAVVIAGEDADALNKTVQEFFQYAREFEAEE